MSHSMESALPAGSPSGDPLLRTLADALEVGVLACGGDGRILHANPAFALLSGLATAEVVGRAPEDLAPLRAMPDLGARLASARRSGGAFTDVCALPVAGGVRRCRIQVAPRGAGGDGTVILLSDVGPVATHGQRQAVLDFALDRVQEFVYLIDEDARILYVNDAACRSLGYTRSELLNMTVLDITTHYTLEQWREHWASVANAGIRTVYASHVTREGHAFPAEIRVNHFEHEGRGYHLTLVTDISDRRRAESLEDRLREFLTLAENLPDNVARYGPDGRATYVNSRLEQTLGMSRDVLLGTRPTEMAPPDSHMFDGYEAGVMRSLATGEPQTVELDFPGPEGRQYHQIRMIAERDPEGRVVGVITLGRDVTERNRHLQQIDEARKEAERHARELARARDAALQASRVKSEFLANMSHEIRTPMNGVLGLTDLLLASDLQPSERELAEGIHRSGIALLTIINDILDLSKLEAGRMTLSKEPFDLLTLCNDVVSLLSARADQRGLRLRLELAPNVPLAWLGDAGRLRQVLLNLIGNALKFTPSGEVVVQARADGEPVPRLVIDVRDTGIGIPADRLDAVFDSFTQADGSITRRFGGTGLGLSITRQLVELMGGEIRVSSEVGRGSTFTCVLPLPVVGRETVAPPPPPAAEPRAPLPPLGLNVLLVEDNAINRLVATKLLREWRCTQTSAEDGSEALDRMRSGGFDVVLMDVQMPVMDGLTAVAHWRAIERTLGGHTPVVALTAHAMDGDRERCMEAGMDDYVSKPLRPEELHAAIRRAHALRQPPGTPAADAA